MWEFTNRLRDRLPQRRVARRPRRSLSAPSGGERRPSEPSFQSAATIFFGELKLRRHISRNTWLLHSNVLVGTTRRPAAAAVSQRWAFGKSGFALVELQPRASEAAARRCHRVASTFQLLAVLTVLLTSHALHFNLCWGWGTNAGLAPPLFLKQTQ